MTTGAAVAAIVYPETDGMPLPDGEYQAPLYIRVVSSLRVHFRNVPGARVNGDTFLYYIEGDNNRRVSPDCYVVFGLSEAAQESLSLERHNTYLIWEVGKPPDFVLEIASKSTASVDIGRKRDLYAELGVPEYWRYDGTGGKFYGDPLVGEYLANGEYHRFEMRYQSDGRVWSHSDVLNLDIWWEDGILSFWDPVAGRWLLSHEEEKDRADQERYGRMAAETRADTAETRADAAEIRAGEEMSGRMTAEARLAQLEAELRRLRGE